VSRFWSLGLTLAVAFVLLFIGIFILHPVYPNVCDAAEHGAQQKCEPYHILLAIPLKIAQVLSHAETWTALGTIFIAAFTFTLKRSTDHLWEATLNAAKRQEKDTRILERAYISVEPAGIHPFNSAEFIVGHVKFVNRGHLPARKVSEFIWMKKGNQGLRKEELPIGTIPERKLVIAPQTYAGCGTNSLEGKDIADSDYLYVYGKVTYLDGFESTPRWIEFCHRYPSKMARDVTGGKAISSRYARYHEEGNDADENESK
jgi:hypothetical protein